MLQQADNYLIKLNEFEGPFDLLLFFIQRDELDIYDIPIHQITRDFIDYIHEMESLNIELASEFILFASTLMNIKSKMLIPRKEVDEHGNEIDPRQELVDKILEYKRFKEVAHVMEQLEDERKMYFKRGNAMEELNRMGQEMSEGTEAESINTYKLYKAYERILQQMELRIHKPQHVVVRYDYTMEGQRDYIRDFMKQEKKVAFERIFLACENRIHAIFNFLVILELAQVQFLKILSGEGRNNFILEYLPEAA